MYSNVINNNCVNVSSFCLLASNRDVANVSCTAAVKGFQNGNVKLFKLVNKVDVSPCM